MRAMDGGPGAGATGRGLVIGLLGSVEVVSPSGTLVGIAQPMLRILVAMLGVASGRVVTDEALVDGLWGEEWSRHRERNLHTHVSALRRRLEAAEPGRGRARLMRSGGGYRLVLNETELDAALFRSLAARGRAAAQAGDATGAVGFFSTALGLWRGAALADVTELCPRLAGDAVGLDEQRARVLEERIECDLTLGRHGEVAAEGPGLITEFPWRERLAGQLMVALWRCGRRGEALAVFDTTRRMLAQELGLDPGPELVQLHAKVLADDPALAGVLSATVHLPRVIPRQLPAGVRYFAGRDAELKFLDELLDDSARPGTVVVTAVGGMAGVGKTALVVHWAQKIAGRFPGGQLYVNLRGYDPAGAPVGAEVVTGWFLAALGVPASAIPADAQARAALYLTVLADRRVLIVLDNARDAAQVRPLLAGGPGSQVIVTSRSSLAGLAATEGARLIRLGLPQEDEADALLSARLGPDRLAAEPEAVESLVHACGRLPLALAIAAARAAESPDLPLSALAAALASEPSRLDVLDISDEAASVRAVFSWSLRYLSDPAAQMFALLGVHCGPDISLLAAASLAGIPAIEARTALTELVSASLARKHQPGRYILHDLLRAYAAERAANVCTEPQTRAAVGRSIDHYLHTMAGRPSFWTAGFAISPSRPGVVPEALADHAHLLAWLRAEHHVLRHVIEQAADSGFETEAWQIFYFFGFSAYWQGKWSDWAAAGQTALAAAAELSSSAGLGWTRFNLGNLHTVLGAEDEALAQVHQALKHFQEAGDLLGEALVRQGISDTLINTERRDRTLRSGKYHHATAVSPPELQHRTREGLRHAEQALALYEGLGCKDRQAETLACIGHYHACLGNFELALDACQRALELSREIGNPECQADAWDVLGYTHWLAGDSRLAIKCYQEALKVLPGVGPRSVLPRANLLTELGDTYEATGDSHAARQAWRDALHIFEDLRHPDADFVRARLDSGSGSRPAST
jgi:DNA-binding SARP family transcriptional activator